MGRAVLFGGGPLASRVSMSVGAVTGGRAPAGLDVDVIAARVLGGVNQTAPSLLVAADSGLDLAQRLGFDPDLVIGDMDSVSAEALRSAELGGARIETFDSAKDETDFELALIALREAAVTELTVIGSDTGRLDHLFATITTLASPQFSDISIEAWLGENHIVVIHGRDRVDPSATRLLVAPVGSLVSILALNGSAHGVTTTGLRWQLDDALLEVGSSLGVSNEFVVESAEVGLSRGCVVAIVPDRKEK